MLVSLEEEIIICLEISCSLSAFRSGQLLRPAVFSSSVPLSSLRPSVFSLWNFEKILQSFVKEYTMVNKLTSRHLKRKKFSTQHLSRGWTDSGKNGHK